MHRPPPEYLSVGANWDGGFAEYVTLRSEAVIAVPEDMDPAEAAPMLCAGVSTYRRSDLNSRASKSHRMLQRPCVMFPSPPTTLWLYKESGTPSQSASLSPTLNFTFHLLLLQGPRACGAPIRTCNGFAYRCTLYRRVQGSHRTRARRRRIRGHLGRRPRACSYRARRSQGHHLHTR